MSKNSTLCVIERQIKCNILVGGGYVWKNHILFFFIYKNVNTPSIWTFWIPWYWAPQKEQEKNETVCKGKPLQVQAPSAAITFCLEGGSSWVGWSGINLTFNFRHILDLCLLFFPTKYLESSFCLIFICLLDWGSFFIPGYIVLSFKRRLESQERGSLQHAAWCSPRVLLLWRRAGFWFPPGWKL